MKITKTVINKYIGSSNKELTNAGICPTCFDRLTNHSVFGDDSKLVVYKDKDIECLFVGNPRAIGHMIISTQKHYQDLSEAPDRINKKVISFAKQLMIIIKHVFGCERVYICSMCDGPANHYHLQLIPRYPWEERGKENFVKPRQKYVFDKIKFNKVKILINDYATKKYAK